MTRFTDDAANMSREAYLALNDRLREQLRGHLVGQRRYTIETGEDSEAGQVVEKSDAGDAGKGGGE